MNICDTRHERNLGLITIAVLFSERIKENKSSLRYIYTKRSFRRDCFTLHGPCNILLFDMRREYDTII